MRIRTQAWDSGIQLLVETIHEPHVFILDGWGGRLVHATTYHCLVCGLPEDEHPTLAEQAKDKAMA